ncbi:diphosphomevalonate decarboxylase [Nocardia sp. NPDC051321]|uniref:diphosphomevalonate decarboxylase n=1 Tax=Nocardia sp. NPDC051321 TaxID=3364323 RepID=UPI003790161F
MTSTSIRPSTVTAVAHPNIALIKYWGKRDEEYILPCSDSLSITLDIYPTTTTVWTHDGAADQLTINGVPADGGALRRVEQFLELVRARAQRPERLVVETVNTVPTGAGLASSASGFAALALAATRVYGLDIQDVTLSALARRGSGSASRSVYGGFSIWHAGTGRGAAGDSGSYAEPIDAAVDLALVVAVVETAAKPISSREAMSRTVRTSPLFRAWVESSRLDLAAMRAALRRGDLDTIGEIAERNALGMHATMLAARPAVRYLSQASLTVLDRVAELRRAGVGAYATVDAGPNVKVICAKAAADAVATALRELTVTREVIVAGPGPGARITAEEPR